MVKSFLIDTGATDTFVRENLERFLTETKPSQSIIHIADNSTIPATVDGTLNLFALNTPRYKGLGLGCQLSTTATVVPNLSQELLSISEIFTEQNGKIIFDSQGVSEIITRDESTGKETRVPVRYDYVSRSFYLDCIVSNTPEHDHLLASYLADRTCLSSASRANALKCSLIRDGDVSKVVKELQNEPQVEYVRSCLKSNVSGAPEKRRTDATQFANAATTDPLSFRKRLIGNNKGLNKDQAADLFAHIGCTNPQCWTCRQVLGAGRYEKKSKPEERVQSAQPCHTFTLDLVQWSHSGRDGELYTAVMQDTCTGGLFGLNLFLKTDIYNEIRDFVIAHRENNDFNWMPYKFCSQILLDNDPIWDEDCERWRELKKELSFQCTYSDPDRKNTNARPENAVRELERRTKSLLFSRNLSPECWPECVKQACWLKQRMPYKQRSRRGDDMRPLEQMTDGAISRSLIDDELSYFVPVGTPCMVWDPSVKGSSLKSKVRWGIAVQMLGKAVQFKCPYTLRRFKSRSYLAIKLKEGINYYTFLGIKSPPMTSSCFVPVQIDSKTVIEIQELTDLPDNVEISVQNVSGEGGEMKPLVSVIDKNGRMFEPNANGDFKHNGFDLMDETSGFMKLLADKNLVKHGYNNIQDDHDHNYLVAQLSNNPRFFNGKTFFKDFTIGTFQGKVTSYSQKTKYWTVKYEDGDAENFEEAEILHYVINKLQSDFSPEKESTEKGTDKGKLLDEPDVPSTAKLSEESSDAAELNHASSCEPDEDEDECEIIKYECYFKCKRFQLLPKINHAGEAPPTDDFWKDIIRRVTTDKRTGKVIEDFSNEKLRQYGAVGKLPANVKEISVIYYLKIPKGSGVNDLKAQENFNGAGSYWKSKPGSRRNNANFTYTSKPGDKVKLIMKAIGIRPEYLRSYFKYLSMPASDVLINKDNFEKSLNSACKPGIVFESPQGERWRQILRGYHEKQNMLNPVWKCAQLAKQVLQHEIDEIKLKKRLDLDSIVMSEMHARRAVAHIVLQKHASRHARFQNMNKEKAVALLANVKIELQKKMPISDEPKTIFEALTSENAHEWAQGLIKEDDKLDSLNVFLHDQTEDQLKKLGITGKFIIPSRYVVTTKKKDGIISELKVRKIIQGHKYAMQKGTHYDESFTPTPTQDTLRVMQAFATGRGLARYAFDVCSAYQNAPAVGPKLGIKYPKGFERFDANGRPLYAVLQANLNGKADAGRQWGMYRDCWIMETFNNDEFKCVQSLRDPCLFTITDSNGKKTYMICYTDDLDCYTEEMSSMLKISKAFDKKFGIKVVNPDYMLGVVRKQYEREGVLYTHLTQTAYIEEVYKTFRPFMPENIRSRSTHFPKGERLYIGSHDAENKEIEAVKNRGYLKLVGSLLWYVRNTAPALSFGVNQLCKVMSSPTEHAWDLGMHILKYAYDTRHEGIVFRSNGNKHPEMFYDASFNPDPTDGKSQYGFVCFYYGGPVSWTSKKLAHVGTHVGMNETMAQCFAAKQATWIKFLIEEMESGLEPPVKCFGDNDQATRLAQEDMMTSANKYYQTSYYWTKESQKLGYTNCDRVDTALNVSDVLTKAADKPTCDRLQPRLTGHIGQHGDMARFCLKDFKYNNL